MLSSVIGVLLSLLLAGCGIAPPAPADPLTVAAAADLSPLTDSLGALYRAESGRDVRFVVGSSGMLARQVSQGAPYDVYLSANARYVEELVQAGKIARDSVTVYAHGRLGIWWKGGAIREARELLRPEIRRLAMANPAHAPYGEAARDYLERAGIWAAVEPKVVYGENVRQAAQFASTGNADALLSSWTLVRPMGGSLVAAGAHAPIRQAGGAVAGRPNEAEARRFLSLLSRQKAQALLREHGLDAPEPATAP